MTSEQTFPDDIMIEILLKLPVQSILQCNTLSKHYYSLIHSQFFIRRHLGLVRLDPKIRDLMIAYPVLNTVRVFDSRGHVKDLVKPPPMVENSSNLQNNIICGPVNGLYCVGDPSNIGLISFTRRIALWNPSTREHFLLPCVPQSYDNSDEKLGEGSFWLERYSGCGLGYDEVTNDYKVVLTYNFPWEESDSDSVKVNKYTFYVFSVSKGEWRNPEGYIREEGCSVRSKIGVFFHGACHWIYENYLYLTLTVIALDMSNESLEIISFPDVGNEYKWSYKAKIVIVNGCLSLVNSQKEDYYRGGSWSFDVWVMSQYGDADSWSIMYRISLPPGIRGRFLGIVRGRFFVKGGDGRLVSYNLDSDKEECYDILDAGLDSLLPYEESLVRINMSV